MAHIVWTPWRDLSEILAVRSQLYPSAGSKEPDSRRRACAQISAWKTRSNLPHAVESTWFLTDAVLTEYERINDLAARQCYATAFCRFVTGLVDSEQDARSKVSMFIKAKQINLPISFVELRHEATHGDLPSLAVLRKAANKALEWLWNDYWEYFHIHMGNLDEDKLSAFKDGCEKLKQNFRDILRSYRSESLQATKLKSHPESLLPAPVTTKTCDELVSICNGERLALLELVKVLLEYKMLIPSSKILGRHMDEVFSVWDSLLKSLAIRQTKFLTIFTDETVIHIISPSFMDVMIDTYREAVTMWLMHIYTAEEWAATIELGRLDDHSVLSTCLQNPNHWTLRLAAAIIDGPGHKKAREIYGERVRRAVAHQSTPKDLIIKTISVENLDHLLPSQRTWLETEEGLQEQAITSQMNAGISKDQAEVGGWEKWKRGWISKPIGMV